MQYLVLHRLPESWRSALADVIHAAEQATGYESACPSEYDDIIECFRNDVIDEIDPDTQIDWIYWIASDRSDHADRSVGVGAILEHGSVEAMGEFKKSIEHLAPEYRDAFVERFRELKSVTEEA